MSAKQQNIEVIHVLRNAEPVAKFTIGLMLAETRNIARFNESVLRGGWDKNFNNDQFMKPNISDSELENLKERVEKQLNEGFEDRKIRELLEIVKKHSTISDELSLTEDINELMNTKMQISKARRVSRDILPNSKYQYH